MGTIQVFLKADWSLRLLFFRVFVLLGIGRLNVLVFPFRKIAKRIGLSEKESSREREKAWDGSLSRLASSIESVSKYTPWKTNCFNQALCAHWILKRKKYAHTIYFGVAKDDVQGMSAHAWLRVGNRIITGIKGREKYTAVGRFTWFPHAKE